MFFYVFYSHIHVFYNYGRNVPVPPLFGLFFRTQVKNLLSSEAICGDQITLKQFSAGVPPRTPSPESWLPSMRSLQEGLQG